MSDIPDSFEAAEKCLDLTAARLQDYPQERARVARLIAHIQRGMEQSASTRLKPFGLNYSAYNAVMMLYGAPDYSCSASELSDATGEKRTNITRISDELLAAGFIERHQALDDRRKVILRLTDKGRQTAEAAQPTMWASLEALYGGFTPAEMQEFLRLLRKQLTHMDRRED